MGQDFCFCTAFQEPEMQESLARWQRDTPGTLGKVRLGNVRDEEPLCWGCTEMPDPLTVNIPGSVRPAWSSWITAALDQKAFSQ